MEFIWYPGSAYASQEWIDYLFKTISGNYFFSDIKDNWCWESNKTLTRFTHDTLDNRIPKVLQDLSLNTLILSRHPDLKTFGEIVNSQILQNYKPVNFIYDPGTNMGDIDQHLKENLQFSEIGYQLKKIIVLPHLEHQYCEYKLNP